MDLVEEAFGKVDRSNFLTPETRHLADGDVPLPIGYGQTNSQPTTVKLMLHWLDAQPGYKVLDVGLGSGWTSALLAFIVGPKGQVYAMERVLELVEFGRDNVERVGFKNVHFFQAGDRFGLPEHAPYDRILVSASADRLPDELVGQLRPSGKMVIPIHDSVWEIWKSKNGELNKKEHQGFVFVPLI